MGNSLFQPPKADLLYKVEEKLMLDDEMIRNELNCHQPNSLPDIEILEQVKNKPSYRRMTIIEEGNTMLGNNYLFEHICNLTTDVRRYKRLYQSLAEKHGEEKDQAKRLLISPFPGGYGTW